MASGETLLKISDYPFAYSFIGIICNLLGFSISHNQIVYFGIAGAFGTLLAILDPFGVLIRVNMKHYFHKVKSKKSDDDPSKLKINYNLQAINTRAIGVEMDKIVGILYFAITTSLFLIVLSSNVSFAEVFEISDKHDIQICDKHCIQFWGVLASGIASALLVVVGYKKWFIELHDKISIAGMHQLAIGNEYATSNSVENMSRSVEQNDWETAKKWGEKIKDEIQYKKSKREIIIKTAENIYRPLHEESVQINTACLGVLTNRHYYSISVQAWNAIKSKSDQVMIEEVDFRKKIDSFYDSIDEYNRLVVSCNAKLNEMINNRVSEIYKKKTRSIRYWVTDSSDGRWQIDLIGCAFLNIRPSHFHGENDVPYQLDIEYFDTPGTSGTYTTNENNELQLFETVWDAIENDVKNDGDFSKVKELYAWIEVENKNLMVKYGEKIEMQWKV